MDDRFEHVQSKEELLNELIHYYGNDLKRIAYSYVKDMAQCDDIVQEVFISCYQHLHTFRGEAEYKTWLIRITLNKCKDYHRKWSFRNLIYHSSIKKHVDKESVRHSAEQEVMQQEGANEIFDAIATLKPKYKEVLILYYVQDLTLKEISEIMKFNLNTIKTRFNRGKDQLQKELRRRGYNNGSV
ncbi:sigma-70 family RNA polymerase sigma factor [Gracilibacillus salinarum]|uniref:Sigma-70 family RNA polymerase sigma factor n=1 Tax=Gracilibacillus salinarum TaxID=2932255 RepID=A0ABY4GSU1_9BACI|nr:sigma-70 family RNA polymerase sigma factor [Gracilibacillus salinarum]UOQ87462.1 sigma-70 family RNA polymerase sigma factor [Gracilibacillus salinarum]